MMVADISRLMGPPRFAIIVCPISRNVAGVIDAIDRLRLNHVPRNTPGTPAHTGDKREEAHRHELNDCHGGPPRVQEKDAGPRRPEGRINISNQIQQRKIDTNADQAPRAYVPV